MAGEAAAEQADNTIITVEVDGDLADVTLGSGVDAGMGEGKPAPKQPASNGGAAAASAPAVDEAAAALQRSLDEEKKRTNAARAATDAERRRADAASIRADQAEQEAKVARDAAETSELTTVVSGIEAAQQELVAAKSAFKAAHEAGDADGMADAQARIGSAASAKDRLTDKKQTLETAATRRAAEPPPRPREADAGYVSPQERYITGSGFAPKAQDWLREHPECVPPNAGGDASKNAAMMKGHWEAIEKGIPMNSEKYFEVLDTHIGARAAPAAGDGAELAPASKKPTQRQAMPSAPPSREPPTPDGRPTGKQSVQLTRAMQEIAELSFPQKAGEDDTAWKKRAYGTYATEYIQAKAEGKIGRITH